MKTIQAHNSNITGSYSFTPTEKNINIIHNDRKGDWIQTSSGIRFYPLDPRIEEINITDIAWALAHQCRFSGHCSEFYSVAQHSLFVASLCDNNVDDQKAALLHDASEAYLVDIPRPLKELQEFSAYRTIETQLQRMIFRRFGIDPDTVNWNVIKVYDDAALHTEGAWLMPDVKSWGTYGPEKVLKRFSQYTMGCMEAHEIFIKKFRELFGGKYDTQDQ